MATVTMAEENGKKNGKTLFEYPGLPRFELAFYYLVVVCSLIYAWTIIYEHNRAYQWADPGVMEAYEDANLPFGLGTFRKDSTESEWALWKIYAFKLIPWMFGHSLLFNFGEQILPQSIWSVGMLLYWFIAHFSLAGRLVMMAVIVEGLTIYISARMTRSKAITWIVGLGFIYATASSDYFVIFDEYRFGFYVVVLIFPYKTVAFLSYTTETLDSRKAAESGDAGGKKSICEDSFLKGIFEMFWYAFYLPYCCHLKVIYKRFKNQSDARSRLCRNGWAIGKFGARIFFWAVFAELTTYLFYFAAMMQNHEYLKTIRKDLLLCIGFACGQFFHLKYVVIFGMPSFFARLDNMRPLDGPICLARVTQYSKIWRYFDRGLYEFFKEHIYLPVCRPTFSIGGKICGVFLCFGFVLIWHGITHQYLVWIALNIGELFLEIIAKAVYSIPGIKRLREARISHRNFRRFLACLQVITFAFGWYSTFYFVGSSRSGYVFVDRIFWQETVALNWPAMLLICQTYCFSHICMEDERRNIERAKIDASDRTRWKNDDR